MDHEHAVGSIRVGDMSAKKPQSITPSPLRRHAADALRRARTLPVGHARNDLRQLAMGLLWLERRGMSQTKQAAIEAIEMGGDREGHV